LVRGSQVNPRTICKPEEGCLDRPEMFLQFNGAHIGNRITNMKITVTQDEVDCGSRKITEEVTLSKYSDFEQFSFHNIVEKLREKLDLDVYLRIHVINNFTFDDDLVETDADINLREQEMEEGQ
jgi:hypothetical protein